MASAENSSARSFLAAAWRVERGEGPGNPRQGISGAGTFPETL